MSIRIGKSYIIDHPEVFPHYMRGAKVKIIDILPSSGLNLVYSYKAKNGDTGEGTMSQEYAEEALTPLASH